MYAIETSFKTFTLDHERKMGHHEWKGYGKPEEIKQFYLDAIELLKSKGYKKWLCDNRNQPTLTQEIQDWARDVFFPTALGAGIKYFAFVEPGKLIPGNTLKKVFNEAAPFQSEYFKSIDEALEWLDLIK